MPLNIRIQSSSRTLSSHEPTREGLLSLLDACARNKRIAGRHYQKPTRIDFWDVQTGIFLHTVR